MQYLLEFRYKLFLNLLIVKIILIQNPFSKIKNRVRESSFEN